MLIGQLSDLFGQLIIGALAAWRLSRLLRQEKGPFGLFVRLRRLAGVEHDGDEPVGWPESFWGELLGCHYCFSIWAAAGIILSWWLVGPLPALVLAVSAGAVFIEEVLSRGGDARM